MESTGTVSRGTTHRFNCNKYVTSNYQPLPGERTSFNVDTANNSTIIDEEGTTATLVITGKIRCHNLFRTDLWVQRVNILQVVGTVHSCRNMWNIVCVFPHLTKWTIEINNQYKPSDWRLPLDEVDANNSITHIKIFVNCSEFKRNHRDELKRGITKLVLCCLRFAAKCTKLSTFHFELPDDDGNSINIALGDFIMGTTFDTVINIHKKSSQILMILCVETGTTVEENSGDQAATSPQPLTTTNTSVVAVPRSNPGSGQPQINTPDCKNNIVTSPSAKRRKPQ